VAHATIQDVEIMLRDNGASDAETGRIVAILQSAGLSAPRMRAWLDHPQRAYPVDVGDGWLEASTDLLKDGHADLVIAAAEDFAAGSPEEREIALTLLCNLKSVRAMTHRDPARTEAVLRIARRLLRALRKDIAVNEAVQTTFSGNFDDLTRLVDWMKDDRLQQAVDAIESGAIDPIKLRAFDSLFITNWGDESSPGSWAPSE
jgi:hypothetical protein